MKRANVLALVLGLGLLQTTGASWAATYTWPNLSGSGLCQGTLQNCVDTVGVGDQIIIGADESFLPDRLTRIDENVLITRSVTLGARDGIDAVLAAGRILAVSTSGASTANITVSRLAFERGRVVIQHATTGPTNLITLSQLRFADVSDDQCAVNFVDFSSAAGPMQLVLGDSIIQFGAGTAANPPRSSGLCASSSGPELRVDAFRNLIQTSRPRLRAAISVNGSGVRTVNVTANVVRANTMTSGITVTAYGPQATRRAITFRDNFVRGQRVDASTSEYAMAIAGEAIDARVINNTVIDNSRGLFVAGEIANAIIGRVSNNAVAYNLLSGMGLDTVGTTNLVNQNNLVFGNSNDFFTPGSGTIALNPQFESLLTGFATIVSPLLNTGLDADLPAFIGGEAAGDPRRLQAAVDIGAFEYHDDRAGRLIATASNTGGNTTDIDVLGALSTNENIIATPLMNPAADITQNLGVYLASTAPLTWSLYLQQPIQNMTVGRQFNVLAPLFANAHFRHVTSAGTISGDASIIDSPDLNGRPFALPIAFARYESPTSSSYHDFPIGMEYIGSRWRVRNQDGAAMAADRAFSIVVPPLFSPNAFVVSATGNTTALALIHPMLDENPCAAPLVGRGDDSGDAVHIANPTPFALEYRAGSAGVPGHWFVRSASAAAFPAGSAFSVQINGRQALGCGAANFANSQLFADGFE